MTPRDIWSDEPGRYYVDRTKELDAATSPTAAASTSGTEWPVIGPFYDMIPPASTSGEGWYTMPVAPSGSTAAPAHVAGSSSEQMPAGAGPSGSVDTVPVTYRGRRHAVAVHAAKQDSASGGGWYQAP